MFGPNPLPPPTSFGHEPRPLCLTAESARAQPQGGCHFQHPSAQHQRCLCQTYQHNRLAPGNICDCGHSACYHSANNTEPRLPTDRVVSALVEKVKKLEELVIKERETRNNLISRERQTWEKEVRILREALAPFYRSESEMRRKLLELEDKLDMTGDEAARLKLKVSTIDDINTALERHLAESEIAKCRKRKASLGHDTNGVMSPDSNYTCSSSASDATSISLQRSSQPPSPKMPCPPPAAAMTSPRSSGVLNLTSGARYDHTHNVQSIHEAHRLPSPSSEPRSSGFLSIDLAERFRNQTIYPGPASHPTRPTINGMHHHKAAGFAPSGLPSPPDHKISSGALPVSGLLSEDPYPKQLDVRSPKKLKQQNASMTGLELLANVATPLAQRG